VNGVNNPHFITLKLEEEEPETLPIRITKATRRDHNPSHPNHKIARQSGDYGNQKEE